MSETAKRKPFRRAVIVSGGFQINLCDIPGKKRAEQKPLIVEPDGTVEISLDKYKDRLTKFISERQAMESIQKAEVEIGLVIFEDKTAWSAGNFLRLDSDNPGKFQPISSDPNNSN